MRKRQACWRGILWLFPSQHQYSRLWKPNESNPIRKRIGYRLQARYVPVTITTRPVKSGICSTENVGLGGKAWSRKVPKNLIREEALLPMALTLQTIKTQYSVSPESCTPLDTAYIIMRVGEVWEMWALEGKEHPAIYTPSPNYSRRCTSACSHNTTMSW